MHFRTFVEVSEERYEALKVIHKMRGFNDTAFDVFFPASKVFRIFNFLHFNIKLLKPPGKEIKGPLFVLTSRNGLALELKKRQNVLV